MKILRHISSQHAGGTILRLENQQGFLNTKLKSVNPKHGAWHTVGAWKMFLE